MKTIDEVIKALEYCSGTQNDALHYLKVLKDILDPLKVKKISHEIICPQCNSMIAIILPESNEPLTWDELKQMEGKPVWVETDNVKFWTIVDNFRTICNQECLCCSKGYMCRSTYARGDWQAYRKEREW